MLLHSKGNYKQGEKITLRTGKNNNTEITDKGLMSKIYKQLIQLLPEKQTTQSRTGEKT